MCKGQQGDSRGTGKEHQAISSVFLLLKNKENWYLQPNFQASKALSQSTVSFMCRKKQYSQAFALQATT